MITEGLQNTAQRFRNRMDPRIIASDFTKDPRNATQEMVQTRTKSPAVKPVGAPKKPKINKVGNVETAFFTNQSSGQQNRLRKQDSISDVAGKLLNFVTMTEDERKKHFELYRNFEKENLDEEKRRHDELVEALKKRREEKPKPEEKKQKETEKVEGKKAEPTKPTEPTKAPPKTAEPVKVKEPVKAPEVKPPTAKPAEISAPQPPTAVVPKPPVTTGISTAAKVITAVGVGALAGKEALAENISKYESKGAGGYNAYNKGTVGNKMIGADKPIDFSKMTISEFLRRGALKPGDPDRLFAVGRYQIIPTTMQGLVKKLKLDPDKTYLDPETQDSLFSNGLVGIVRKKVDDYIKGLSDDKDAAILELAKEFASVGVPFDMMVGKKQLKKGDSYYSGVGGNKAHNSPEEVGAALDADRLKKLGATKPALAENVSKYETGQKVAEASVANQELKKQRTSGTTVAIDNTQTNVSTMGNQNSTQILSSARRPDLPLHQQG